MIAPLSTISNWQREFETWSDINAVVYHGRSVAVHVQDKYYHNCYYKILNSGIVVGYCPFVFLDKLCCKSIVFLVLF